MARHLATLSSLDKVAEAQGSSTGPGWRCSRQRRAGGTGNHGRCRSAATGVAGRLPIPAPCEAVNPLWEQLRRPHMAASHAPGHHQPAQARPFSSVPHLPPMCLSCYLRDKTKTRRRPQCPLLRFFLPPYPPHRPAHGCRVKAWRRARVHWPGAGRRSPSSHAAHRLGGQYLGAAK